MSQSSGGTAPSITLPSWTGEAPTNYKDIRESLALALASEGVSEETADAVIKTVDDAVVANETHLEWPSTAGERPLSEGSDVRPDTTIHVDNVPPEAVEFAFDQIEARGMNPLLQDYYRYPLTLVECDYKQQSVTLRERTTVEQVLLATIDEKLSDMLWEVKRGERDDYSKAELQEARNSIEFTLTRQRR